MGAAWGDPIAGVEVQIDDGAWQPATLTEGAGEEFAWTFWTLDWGTPSRASTPSPRARSPRTARSSRRRTTRSWPARRPTGRATARSPGACKSPDPARRGSHSPLEWQMVRSRRPEWPPLTNYGRFAMRRIIISLSVALVMLLGLVAGHVDRHHRPGRHPRRHQPQRWGTGPHRPGGPLRLGAGT